MTDSGAVVRLFLRPATSTLSFHREELKPFNTANSYALARLGSNPHAFASAFLGDYLNFC
jgi:hypothetical protein